MKNIVVWFLLLFSYPVTAAWGAFYVVTLKNIEDKEFTFYVKSIDRQHVVFCLSDENIGNDRDLGFFKSAWLVKSLLELGSEDLNFEQHLGKVTNSPHIESSSLISTDIKEDSDCKISINVDIREINRSYIYVGYDEPLIDGGLRYIIILSSFVK
ncbi:hypothetical protein ABC502_09910 [Alkalimonas sp. NCh-2]|uniref:hypothetical protein n=1 Tax=Alkalimonas sp. NCh-2 TaxID=3144846 RepID=UPI0031F6CD68